MDKYVLTDGTRFIAQKGNGQYVAEDNENKALILPKKEAEKVLNNNLNKAFRKIFKLKKTDKKCVVETSPQSMVNKAETKYSETENNSMIVNKEDVTDNDGTDVVDTPSLTAVAQPNIAKSVTKETQHYNTPARQNEQFMADMKMVASYFKNANDRKKQLQNRLDYIEKEILDIRHYIEFKSLNACEGYNAYKMLRQRLIARRECKNEMRVVEILTAGVFTTKDIASIENVIDSFDTVTYKPRVMNNLFD